MDLNSIFGSRTKTITVNQEITAVSDEFSPYEIGQGDILMLYLKFSDVVKFFEPFPLNTSSLKLTRQFFSKYKARNLKNVEKLLQCRNMTPCHKSFKLMNAADT